MSPVSWNVVAATISIAMLISPAIDIAMTTSILVKRNRRRACSSVSREDPVLRERRVEVDHVRHHRRAEDADGEQQDSVAR